MSLPRQSTAWLARLLSFEGDAAARVELEAKLIALDDPLVVAPLQTLLLDRAASEPTRTSASRILNALTNAPDCTDAQLRQWWREGDLVLQRHALGEMTLPQRDLVESVLERPEHPFYLDAVETLVHGFEGPWGAERLIAALAGARADVRAAAADALLWMEPVAALAGLVAATRDEASEVAERALDTLCYFQTRAAIAAAHAQLEHADADVQASARNCFERLRDDMLDELVEIKHEKHLRAWLGEVWPLLGIEPRDIAARRTTDLAPARAREEVLMPHWLTSLEALQIFLAELDVEEQERESILYNAPWDQVASSSRPLFARSLRQSGDVIVRQLAAKLAGLWRERETLLALLSDPASLVRKSAMYYLRELAPDPELVKRAWAHLAEARGIDAQQTLTSAILLDDPRVWWPEVTGLVRDTNVEEGLRWSAIYELERAGAREELASCLGLVAEAPVLTWSVHTALIECALSLKLVLPDLTHLADVDDLRVQVVLAEVAAFSNGAG
jgi:HEAT repeat protein